MSRFKEYLEEVKNKEEERIYLESGLSRILEHNIKHGIAMLSAWASPDKFKKGDGTIDELAIRENNNTAEKMLNIEFNKSGITYIKTNGQYGRFEHSAFAPFIPSDERSAEIEKWAERRTPETWEKFKKKIIEIASEKSIDQESVLFKEPDSDKAYLYFCKNSSWSEHKKGEIMPLGKLHFTSLDELNEIYHELRKKAEASGENPDDVDAPQYSQMRQGNKKAAFVYSDKKYGEMYGEAKREIILPMSQHIYDNISGFPRLVRNWKSQVENYGPEALLRHGKRKELVEDIKYFLKKEEDKQSWKEFVDDQKLGDCQYIVALIISKFPQVQKIVGEIKTDEPYVDDDGDEQNQMIHHWVKIDDTEYDFAKGTIKEYFSMTTDDLYDPIIHQFQLYNPGFGMRK